MCACIQTHSKGTHLDREVALGAVPGHNLPHVVVGFGLLNDVSGDLGAAVILRGLPGEGHGVGGDLRGREGPDGRTGLVHDDDLRGEISQCMLGSQRGPRPRNSSFLDSQ